VLDKIYYQKDKDKDIEQIEIDFGGYESKFNDLSEIIKESDIENFIGDSFFKNRQNGLNGLTITNQMKRNTSEFINKVIGKSKGRTDNNDEPVSTLCVLRRWNSFTPTLSSSINQSKGGGYFFRFYDKDVPFGIVIDPGFDFLRNFFSQGFKIGDIDLILVSHAHPDHTDNLASILSLLHEMNSRLGEYSNEKKINKKNLTLVLSPGVFEQYNQIISISEKELKDVIVVDGKVDELSFFNGHIKIKPFKTPHQDLSKFHSLGFIITVENKEKHKIGYTGDIKWKNDENYLPDYLKYFYECDIICVHLGSIINILKGKTFCNTFCNDFVGKLEKCDNFERCLSENFENVNVTKSKLIEQTQEENHLFLAGLTMFFNSLLDNKNNKLKLAIISEFGEELKNGIRIDLFNKFNNWLQQKSGGKSKCLPGDIGLEVNVLNTNIYCNCCKRFVENVRPIPYGKEEAICFVCKECESVLSSYQIDHILKDYCENGRQLEPADVVNSHDRL